MFFCPCLFYWPWMDFLIAEQKQRLDIFFRNLIEIALPLGFIGRADENTLWQRHIVDSLLLLPKFRQEFSQNCSVFDLGTGAGLPGIPLAIALPGVHFTLVDS